MRARTKRMELSKDAHVRLKVFAEERELVFFSSPFSVEAVELLEEVGVPAYKVASGELTNTPLLEAIAETRKPALLSSGMSGISPVSVTQPVSASPSSRRKPVRWSGVVIGDTKRTGRWRIHDKTHVVMGIGDCQLDLRSAELDGDEHDGEDDANDRGDQPDAVVKEIAGRQRDDQRHRAQP